MIFVPLCEMPFALRFEKNRVYPRFLRPVAHRRTRKCTENIILFPYSSVFIRVFPRPILKVSGGQRDKEKSVRLEVHGPMIGSSVVIGRENVVRQSIQESFHIGPSPEIRATLEELTAAVHEMVKHLPAEVAEEVLEDLRRLQEELQKPEPKREWYSVSIGGLIKAAENVGRVGIPVVELARKRLQLLGARRRVAVPPAPLSDAPGGV